MSAKPLKKTEPNGLGWFTFQNDDIALIGPLPVVTKQGFRLQGSPGTSRLKFIIIDVDMVRKGTPQEKADVGFVDMNMRDDDTIEGLVNIEIKPSFRGRGIGRRVVDSLLATTGGHLKLYDIRKKAHGFWRKMGSEFDPKAKGPINGRIARSDIARLRDMDR